MRKRIVRGIVVILSFLVIVGGGFFAWLFYAFHSSHAMAYGDVECEYTSVLTYNPEGAAEELQQKEELIEHYQATGESPVFLEHLLNSKEKIKSCYLWKGGMKESVYVEVDFTELVGRADAVLYRASNYKPMINVYAVQWEEVYREPITEAGIYNYELSEYEDGVYRFVIEPDGEVTSDGEMKHYSKKQNRLTAYEDFTERFESVGKKLLSFFGEKPEDYNTDLFVLEY